MSQSKRVGSLEIGQDLDFQRREWTVQRVAWAVVAVILIAGVAGLLGGGPLSRAQTSAGPLALDYERFVRKRAPTQFDLTVAHEAAVGGEVGLWLDRALLEKLDVERIEPEPTEMEGASDRVVYRFALANPEEPAQITFHLEPAEPGTVSGTVGLVDGQELAIDQFIYP